LCAHSLSPSHVGTTLFFLGSRKGLRQLKA
jgi:hypothetical protein